MTGTTQHWRWYLRVGTEGREIVLESCKELNNSKAVIFLAQVQRPQMCHTHYIAGFYIIRTILKEIV